MVDINANSSSPRAALLDSVSAILGTVNNFPFDILGHVGDAVSHHMMFSSTSPTYSLSLV